MAAGHSLPAYLWELPSELDGQQQQHEPVALAVVVAVIALVVGLAGQDWEQRYELDQLEDWEVLEDWEEERHVVAGLQVVAQQDYGAVVVAHR